MTSLPDLDPANLVTAFPIVSIGPARTPLATDAARQLVRLVVDTSLHVPDMFEITFDDPTADLLTRHRIGIGTELTISAAAAGGATVGCLMTGEVTAVEGVFAETHSSVVRGYSADHRMQRRRLTRTFVNMTDSDIATKVATDAGLTVGTIEPTRTAHDHVAQVNQTDWEFLRSRALPLGYEFGVTDGRFHFRPASGVHGARPVALIYPAGLRTFLPRVTAGNLAGQAELRTWDPAQACAAAAVVPTATASADLPAAAGSVADPFGPKAAGPGTRPAPAAAAGRDLGPPPSTDAHVVGARPVTGTAAAAREAALGLAEHLGSTFAEADGEALGDPRLVAGNAVDVGGVGPTFSGLWTITRALHVFDEFGYQTRFEVSGRQDRSLLGLATGGAEPAPRIPGVVCGVVTNVGDPRGLGRVRVALPWLSPTFESDWAPVAHAGAGAHSAALFLPDVDDEVLVGFEFGDPQRPYVLGGLPTAGSRHPLGGPPVKRTGASAAVTWRGIVTPTGNRLAFHDELAPGGGTGPPTASDLVLGTGSADLALVIDQTAGTVALRCLPRPPGSRSSVGTLTIECGPMGTIDVRTGAGGTVNIDGGAQLNLTAAASISLESQGVVAIKGNPIKLN